MLLAADVGGTKTYVALFEENNLLEPLKLKRYASQEYESLAQILDDYLPHKGEVTQCVCALPGMVERGSHCHTTNLPWVVESDKLGFSKALLLNDIEACAYVIHALPLTSLVTLQPGIKEQGNVAIIAPGTGLGEAGLYFDGKSLCPFATEGGHVDFAPITPLQMRLLAYLSTRFDHVSYERILSGPGTALVYRFLIEVEGYKESLSLDKALDPAPMITQAALQGEPLCLATMQLFAEIFAQEASNCALKFLTRAGLYLGGGITPKILPFLITPSFLHAFRSKGRFAPLLSTIPLYAILDDLATLKGAAHSLHLKSKRI